LQSDPAATPTTQDRCRVRLLADHGIVVDDDLNSINAMTPDPNTLMAIKASDCTSDAPLNNQALQRNSMRDESATLTARRGAAGRCLGTARPTQNTRTVGDTPHRPSRCRVIRSIGIRKLNESRLITFAAQLMVLR
jgi:hypothetical protein